MNKYIDQLIEDLEQAAKNPPVSAYIEPPLHLQNDPVIAELALVPYKTIEELTGIKQKVFPESVQLNANQCNMVNKAIFKVFNSLNIDLVDIPDDIPAEILYEALILNWDYPVQYLPSSGFDLELCTGNPETCLYGDFCSCGEDFDEYEIPPRFEELLVCIADSIDAGFICYLNPETLEIEEFPEKMINDPKGYEMMTGTRLKDESLKHKRLENCYVFEPLNSNESFKIMESFAENLEDKNFSEQLFHVLNERKPFANFKWKIDNSPYRQDWFDFKQKRLEDHIKQIIFSEINKITDEDFHEDINGFYNDDGEKIDPASIPVPPLCIICKKYRVNDWEENMLCQMNRHDQRNNSDFICGAFEKE